jgi:hypothetical protein
MRTFVGGTSDVVVNFVVVLVFFVVETSDGIEDFVVVLIFFVVEISNVVVDCAVVLVFFSDVVFAEVVFTVDGVGMGTLIVVGISSVVGG